MNWSSAETTKVVGAGGQDLRGEGEGGGLAQPAEGEALGGPNSNLPVLTRRSSGKWSQTHHSGVWQRMRDNRHVLKWEVQTGYKQNLLPPKDNHTWEQVAQRSCRLHPWRFLKPDWIMPWATWSGLTDDPGLNRTRGWTRDLHILSNLICSMILWTVVCLCLSIRDARSRHVSIRQNFFRKN